MRDGIRMIIITAPKYVHMHWGVDTAAGLGLRKCNQGAHAACWIKLFAVAQLKFATSWLLLPVCVIILDAVGLIENQCGEAALLGTGHSLCALNH